MVHGQQQSIRKEHIITGTLYEIKHLVKHPLRACSYATIVSITSAGYAQWKDIYPVDLLINYLTQPVRIN